MSLELEQVVDSLIKNAPPAELDNVSEDILIIFDVSQSVIKEAVAKFIQSNGVIISGSTIASKWNKHDKSTKFVDYIEKKLFDIDYKTRTLIDIEDFVEDVSYPNNFEETVTKLQSYGEDHYPSLFALNIIPGDGTRILIYGQKSNPENFYSGTWSSNYYLKNGNLTGEIKLDIHYYEDGNVRLDFSEKIDEILSNEADLVKTIEKIEHKITILIIESFNDLNQRTFKNLRRLLPITRSKINWGNAIGNYRLGSDAINKQ